MARGWESKAVEQQQAEALSDGAQEKPKHNLEQLGLQRKREGILLSRQRVLQQLQAAQNPNHRRMLEAALADLNAQLSRLG